MATSFIERSYRDWSGEVSGFGLTTYLLTDANFANHTAHQTALDAAIDDLTSGTLAKSSFGTRDLVSSANGPFGAQREEKILVTYSGNASQKIFRVEIPCQALAEAHFKPNTDESPEEAMYRFEREQEQKTYTDKENAGTLPETQAVWDDWWQETGWQDILERIRQKALLVILDATGPVSKKVFVNPHGVVIDFQAGDAVNPSLEWTIELVGEEAGEFGLYGTPEEWT